MPHLPRIGLLLLLVTAPRAVNPLSVTSVLFLDSSAGGLPPGTQQSGFNWDFVRPWEERRLRMELGEEATPADRLLLELGLLGDADDAVGGWISQLQLRLNGTEYIRQAVTSHMIRSAHACACMCVRACYGAALRLCSLTEGSPRSSARGEKAQAQLFTAMLGLLYTDAVLRPLLDHKQCMETQPTVTSADDGALFTKGAGFIDLQASVPTFGAAFPFTLNQRSILKERQREKRDTRGLGHRAFALASPFGRVETPDETIERRRREAFEDRSLSAAMPCNPIAST